jgi:hypothetical protein
MSFHSEQAQRAKTVAEQVVSALDLKAIPEVPGSEQTATLAALVPTQ